MATLASVKAEGQAALADQGKRNKAIQMASLITTIDVFVEGLADRLENPNKAGILGFGSPAPAAESDMNYDKCVASIQKVIGNALRFRDSFGPAPPQYSKAKSVLDRKAPSKEPILKYDNRKIEFLHEFKNLFALLSSGGKLDCAPYVRLVNLFVKSTTGEKYKFDYDALFSQLNAIIPKTPAEKAAIDEVVEMAMAGEVLRASASMPRVVGSTAIPSSAPEEPAPTVTESEIQTELKASPSTTPAPKVPLTNYDQMRIRGIAAVIAKDPRARGLSSEKILQMAENIHRRQAGNGRRKKTYRKKKLLRKTRKMRRV